MKMTRTMKKMKMRKRKVAVTQSRPKHWDVAKKSNTNSSYQAYMDVLLVPPHYHSNLTLWSVTIWNVNLVIVNATVVILV